MEPRARREQIPGGDRPGGEAQDRRGEDLRKQKTGEDPALRGSPRAEEARHLLKGYRKGHPGREPWVLTGVRQYEFPGGARPGVIRGQQAGEPQGQPMGELPPQPEREQPHLCRGEPAGHPGKEVQQLPAGKTQQVPAAEVQPPARETQQVPAAEVLPPAREVQQVSQGRVQQPPAGKEQPRRRQLPPSR